MIDDFLKTRTIIDDAREKVIKFEQDKIEEIVNRCLGRQWAIEDLKRFKKVTHETQPFDYYLSFDGKIVATVTRQMAGNKCMVSITPSI